MAAPARAAALVLGVLLSVSWVADAAQVTPVEQVMQLIENLRDEVADEGEKEAQEYEKYSCFCKDETKAKSDEITTANTDINEAASLVESRSTRRDEEQVELAKTKARKEKDSAELDSTKKRCTDQRNSFNTKLNTLDNNLDRLEGAIESITASPAQPAMLVQVHSEVRRSLSDLLKSEPAYESKTGGINSALQKLFEGFKKKRDQMEADFEHASLACKDHIESLEESISTDTASIDRLETSIDDGTQIIEEKRAFLVDEEKTLRENDEYLKELTGMCEDKGKEWDQRSKMRSDEHAALSEVLDILHEKVKDVEGARAFVQTSSAIRKVAAKAKSGVILSLLQEATVRNHDRNSAEAKERSSRVMSILRNKGHQLNSAVLTSMALRIQAATAQDPFAKVKDLIQGLIERLIKEATEEAEKKGFCDERMGKASLARNFRWDKLRETMTKLTGHGVDLDSAQEQRQNARQTLRETEDALSNATSIREEEKAVNLEVIKNATQGYDAVSQVMGILKKFYRRAGRASFEQLNEVVLPDGAGPASRGAYQGNQAAAGGVMGMMEVILADFERTKVTTEQAEREAQTEYASFSQESQATIKAKETEIKNLNSDIDMLVSTIDSGLVELQSTQDLLDKSLDELMELHPLCVDSGMTYEERQAKRDEEIAALKCADKALASSEPVTC